MDDLQRILQSLAPEEGPVLRSAEADDAEDGDDTPDAG